MSTTTRLVPQIDLEPGGFCARFTVEPSEDFPLRCFDVLARHRIEPRSLSIFREPSGRHRLTVTLASGLCAQLEFRKVLDELTGAEEQSGSDPTPSQSDLVKRCRRPVQPLCGVP
jgi:hypothetical protein